MVNLIWISSSFLCSKLWKFVSWFFLRGQKADDENLSVCWLFVFVLNPLRLQIQCYQRCVNRWKTISNIFMHDKNPHNLFHATVSLFGDSANSHDDSKSLEPSEVLAASRDLFRFRYSTPRRPLSRCSMTAAVFLDFWRMKIKNIIAAIKTQQIWCELLRKLLPLIPRCSSFLANIHDRFGVEHPRKSIECTVGRVLKFLWVLVVDRRCEVGVWRNSGMNQQNYKMN